MAVSPDLFQWQVFFQPLSDQGQVRHQHGHSTNVRTIITIARRDCVGYAILVREEFSCLEFIMNRDTINWILKN